MSERAVLVAGFTPLPDGWPHKIETRRDVLLVSDGQHFIGSRPYRGGRSLVVPTGDGTVAPYPGDYVVDMNNPPDHGGWRSLDYQALATVDDDATVVGVFFVTADGLDLVESLDVPAPFDRFKVGGERLPERPAA